MMLLNNDLLELICELSSQPFTGGMDIAHKILYEMHRFPELPKNKPILSFLEENDIHIEDNFEENSKQQILDLIDKHVAPLKARGIVITSGDDIMITEKGREYLDKFQNGEDKLLHLLHLI